MSTRTKPANGEYGGIDYRIDASDATWYDFSASIYRSPSPDELAHREVEVQAFRPSTSGGGVANRAVVAVVLRSGFGLADMMLSAAEARDLAIALIQSAAEADSLTV